MYPWYRDNQQQYLDLQALGNGRLRLNGTGGTNQQVDASVQNGSIRQPRLNNDGVAFRPVLTVASSSSSSQLLNIRRLQEQLDALKRQNRYALSKLFAATATASDDSRQSNDVVPNVAIGSSHSHDVYDRVITTGLVPRRNIVTTTPTINPLQAEVTNQQRNNKEFCVTSSTVLQKRQPILKNEAQVTKIVTAIIEASISDPKPKRPLSAYNLFFQEERKKILGTMSPVVEDHDVSLLSNPNNGTIDADTTTTPTVANNNINNAALASNTTSTTTIANNNINNAALESNNMNNHTTTTTTTNQNDDSNIVESKKRKRYEPHGKMSFASMGKTIAQRWKDLSSDEPNMKRYRDLAQMDKERYHKDLILWKQKRGKERKSIPTAANYHGSI